MGVSVIGRIVKEEKQLILRTIGPTCCSIGSAVSFVTLCSSRQERFIPSFVIIYPLLFFTPTSSWSWLLVIVCCCHHFSSFFVPLVLRFLFLLFKSRSFFISTFLFLPSICSFNHPTPRLSFIPYFILHPLPTLSTAHDGSPSGSSDDPNASPSSGDPLQTRLRRIKSNCTDTSIRNFPRNGKEPYQHPILPGDRHLFPPPIRPPLHNLGNIPDLWERTSPAGLDSEFLLLHWVHDPVLAPVRIRPLNYLWATRVGRDLVGVGWSRERDCIYGLDTSVLELGPTAPCLRVLSIRSALFPVPVSGPQGPVKCRGHFPVRWYSPAMDGFSPNLLTRAAETNPTLQPSSAITIPGRRHASIVLTRGLPTGVCLWRGRGRVLCGVRARRFDPGVYPLPGSGRPAVRVGPSHCVYLTGLATGDGEPPLDLFHLRWTPWE